MVHQMLEGGWRVGQPHRQHGPLEVTVARAECSLGAVLFGEQDLIEPSAQVDLTEVLRALQSVEQIFYVRERIAVAHCEVIETAVIYAEA